jgi:hypothetical protein
LSGVVAQLTPTSIGSIDTGGFAWLIDEHGLATPDDEVSASSPRSR